ncbi:MAG: rhomboid-like protein [bacterium]
MGAADPGDADHLDKGMRSTAEAVLRRSPASVVLYCVVVVTSLVQSVIGREAAERVTEHVSSNLANLLALRWPVLIASAFWLEGNGFLEQLAVWAVLFLLVLIPAERWLGTHRWIIAFALAHVGATIVTALRLWIAVKTGHQPVEVRHVIDVGLSYGFLGVLALEVYRLPYVWRWASAFALFATLFVVLRIDGKFTDAGHLMAVVIGFAMYPLARHASAEAGEAAGAVGTEVERFVSAPAED